MTKTIGQQRRASRRYRFSAILLLALAAVIHMACGRAEAKPAAASIIVDAETGAVLHESNSKARTYPASLTKMMTLYLLFEAIEAKRFKPDDLLAVSAHAARQPATDLGLKTGQQISVEKAILALVVRSANDVAVVVAEALGGTESQFAAMMTQKARTLGMKSTVFRNASGLPDARQVTTARDMAILARALVARFPDFYPYFSAQNFSHRGRVYASHNRVLESYPGADGLKTGYIRASGFNLAASAVRDGRRIIGVVLGGRSAWARDAKMIDLLDKGFALVSTTSATQTAASALPQPPLPTVGTAGLIPPLKPRASTIQVASLAPIGTPAAGDSKPSAGKYIWGIQVGAFNSYQPALKAATRASKRVPDLVKDAQLVVDETAKGKSKLYRARLIGLSKQNAQAACRQLKKKAIDCLVFQADVALAMNSAP